jgi:ribose-phosphate pyrophosphokinase
MGDPKNAGNYRLSWPGMMEHGELDHASPDLLTLLELQQIPQAVPCPAGRSWVWLNGGFQALDATEAAEFRSERAELYKHFVEHEFVPNDARIPTSCLTLPGGVPKIVMVPGLHSGPLTDAISSRLGVPFVKRQTVQYPDGSSASWIGNIRGEQNVVVLQQFVTGEGDRIAATLPQMVRTMKASAECSVTIIFTCAPHQRHDRPTKLNELVSDRTYPAWTTLIENLCAEPGLAPTRIMTVDLHNPATVPQGVGSDLLSVARGLLENVETSFAPRRPLVIFPDAGSITRVHDRDLDNLALLEQIFPGRPVAMVGGLKVRKGGAIEDLTLRRSLNSEGNPNDISGMDAIVVEDIIDRGTTAKELTLALRQAGVASVTLLATHGTFAQGGLSRIKELVCPNTGRYAVDRVVTTDSVRAVGSSKRPTIDRQGYEPFVYKIDLPSFLCHAITRHWGGKGESLRELSAGPFCARWEYVGDTRLSGG